MHDVVDAGCGNVKALRQLVARYAEELEKLLPQNFSRVNPPVRHRYC
jgi:hypothetical protein